METAVGSSLY